MEEKIIVRISGNERGSGRDVALMKEIDRHPERWDFGWDDPEQGLDLLFRLGDREIRWELKEKPDMLQSSESGHLYMQRMTAASYNHPAQIAVLGSDMDVLRCIPKVTKDAGFLNPLERSQIEAAIERWDAACFASGFAAHYFSGGLDNSMRRICRRSRDYLLGKIDLPRPKSDDWQRYCLCGLPSVGPKTSEDLIAAGYRVDLVMTDKPLTSIKGIGLKKARKILDAVAGRR
jgi:hypothetical protein